MAWRWFNADAVKRDKIPLIPVSSFVGRLTDYDSFEEWRVAWQANSLIVAAYNFKVFDGNSEWDVDTPNADFEYAKWYDYFEGTSSGGSSVDGPLPSVLVFPGVAGRYNQGVLLGPEADEPSNAILNVTNLDAANAAFAAKSLSNYLLVGVHRRTATVSTSSSHLQWYVFGSASPITARLNVLGKIVTIYGEVPYYSVDVTSGSPLFYSKVTYSSVPLNQSYNVKLNTNLVSVGSDNYVVSIDTSNGTSNSSRMYVIGVLGFVSSGSSGSDGPVYPPSPDVPTPDPPTVPTVPSSPTISPTINQNVVNQTTTTTVDLTPILDAIRLVNDNIDEFDANVRSEIGSCCTNMRNLLDAWFRYFGDWLQTISGQLDEWNRYILQELRKANLWLEGIFYKSGGGSGSAPDMAAQPTSWWDWLGGILSGLLGDLPAAVSALSGSFDGLHNLFPFSLPWDLAAMLALLVSEPVTPVFDLPLPFAADGVTMVHIDLSPWDGVMSAVRSVMLLVFALGLLLRTRELLKGTEVSQ